MTHLDALELRLSNERIRLRESTTEGARKLRRVWIAQIEKEIADEKEFSVDKESQALTDIELLAALGI